MTLYEIPLGGTLSAAYLFLALGALVLAVLVTACLEWLDLTRFVWHPPLFFVALWTAAAAAAALAYYRYWP